MDDPQPGDDEKAAAFIRAVESSAPICRLCGQPMQGKHFQCVNLKCVWLGTTLADQTGGPLNPPGNGDSNG